MRDSVERLRFGVGDDAPASAPELLPDAIGAVWDDQGWQALVTLETTGTDERGNPAYQRLSVLDAGTGQVLAEHDGQLLEFLYTVPAVGGGALVGFYDGFDVSSDDNPVVEWKVRSDGVVAFPFGEYEYFGDDTVGLVALADDVLVGLDDAGNVARTLGALPIELRDAPGDLQIHPWGDGRALVTNMLEGGSSSGALRVRAYPASGPVIVSEPLPANPIDQGDPFAVLRDPTSRSLLVAYERAPAFTEARLARLRCR